MKQKDFDIVELSPTAYKYYEHYRGKFYQDQDGYYINVGENEITLSFLGTSLIDTDELMSILYESEHEFW